MTDFRERHPERSNVYCWGEAMEFYERRLDEAADEIERLRGWLKEISEEADGDMEGAGEPEFSQFSYIAAKARAALEK
jgi:hypothetical protein